MGADIPGPALVFGNDFDHPVRDRLPPGVGAGMRILKWVVDPGIEGDVYADRPWLYGGVLSSWDRLRVGGVVVGGDDDDGGGVEDDEEEEKDVGVEEGGQDGGEEVRRRIGVPDEAGERKRFFLEKGKREEWVWEKGRGYWGDFFNGFFDFNGEFSFLGGGEELLGANVLWNRVQGQVAGLLVIDIAVFGG